MKSKIKCPSCWEPSINCPDPLKFKGAPLGMYHCPVCGVMQLAGTQHMVCEDCNGTGELYEGNSKD